MSCSRARLYLNHKTGFWGELCAPRVCAHKRRTVRDRADLGGTTGFLQMPTFEHKILIKNQGHHVKALETRTSTRQTRGLGKIRVVRKSTIPEATQTRLRNDKNSR